MPVVLIDRNVILQFRGAQTIVSTQSTVLQLSWTVIVSEESTSREVGTCRLWMPYRKGSCYCRDRTQQQPSVPEWRHNQLCLTLWGCLATVDTNIVTDSTLGRFTTLKISPFEWFANQHAAKIVKKLKTSPFATRTCLILQYSDLPYGGRCVCR